MNRRLFWRLMISILLGALLLFSVLHQFAGHVTTNMTLIEQAHQQTLREFAVQAETLFAQGKETELRQLISDIAHEQQVWAGILKHDGELISSVPLPEHLHGRLGFQRQVNWPVHAFMNRLLIGFQFSGEAASFIVELPEHMHPRADTALVHNLITLFVPSLILGLFCWGLYRHLMKPLEALNRGTQKLAAGDLSARVLPEIQGRRDEITQVAASFDSMADRVERLVCSQRQLLGDLSHELRTPLTRIELALHLCEDGEESAREQLPRLKRDVEQMNHLVEDALTLAWLEGDPEIDCSERFRLVTLLDLLCDDVLFEFPDRVIERNYHQSPALDSTLMVQCNQRALAQSLENILRNAMKYSPSGCNVSLNCEHDLEAGFRIEVADQGPGVAEDLLEKIFEPFFRTDKARSRADGGFGLGLALARRQINAMGGSIHAANQADGGLAVVLQIPSISPT